MKQFDMTMADAKAVAPKRTFLGWLTNACLEFVVLPSFFPAPEDHISELCIGALRL